MRYRYPLKKGQVVNGYKSNGLLVKEDLSPLYYVHNKDFDISKKRKERFFKGCSKLNADFEGKDPMLTNYQNGFKGNATVKSTYDK